MRRRLFLRRFAALFSSALPVAAIPSQTATATAALPTASLQDVELQRSPVAGFQYHQGPSVWSQLAVGAAVDLVREPDNSYDKRAIRVDWQGHKLGYMPRIDNAAVCHLLDTGRTLRARIVALRESPKPWERVEFAVFLQS